MTAYQIQTPYKLVALDMDGTLLNDEKKISEENRKWIAKAIEHGITVMFATGRGVPSVEPYVEELGLKSPMVSVNGGEVWEAPNVLLTRHEMKVEWIRELLDLAIAEDCWYWAYTTEGMFNKERWVDKLENFTWIKFGFFSEDPEQLDKITKIVQSAELYELSNSDLRNIEINPKGVSKASGIREVCKLLDIRMEEVIACGDSLNDLQMIQSVGLGIAMGNAQEDIKRAAKAVTATNEEDGVAQVIRKYLFGE
ncbi:Cof-type HAD-IIB family hydrolase [Gorillibacterium massiliense]|uniref:Cof-type HAD-IIB family hydrolase n=1 Tax=Gorillibacterium massiliense TaxID=1280390 RepID=UPI0004B6CE9C|nr:Cof-type HAD-IIB family hydrolase [Gorillibacterium massiliense]